MSTAVASTDEFKWTEEREKCIELLIQGVPKLRIAKQLDVHRNTVNNWCGHPVFQAELRQRMQEHRDAVQYRRTREMSAMADIAGKHAIQAAKKIEDEPDNPVHKQTFREWTREYRENIREEREVLGTSVQRIETMVGGSIVHQMGKTFRDALVERVRKNVIDVEEIEKLPPMEAVQTMARKLLTADPTVLAAMQDADVAAEQESQADNKKRRR